MKSIAQKVSLVLCGAFLMLSCSPSSNSINPLLGTWTLKGVSCLNCIDKAQETSTTYSCNESGCNTYTFAEDGSLKVQEYADGVSTSASGTYTITREIVTMHLVAEGSSSSKQTYTFKLSGSTLYLNEIVEAYSGKCSATTVLGR